MSGLLEYVVAPLAALLPILLGLGWYLSYVAVRLDRLHTQVEATAAALDAQTVRRAEATVELAYSGAVDPASAALLLDAATHALADQGEWDSHRCLVESELTEVLRTVLPDGEPAAHRDRGPARLGDRAPFGDHEPSADRARPLATGPGRLGGAAEPGRLGGAAERVRLARHFHNEVVERTRMLRRRRVVRALHLAGRTPLPEPLVLDDQWP